MFISTFERKIVKYLLIFNEENIEIKEISIICTENLLCDMIFYEN